MIIKELPRFCRTYSKLQTINRGGYQREDIQFAKWFRGDQVDSTEDEIFDILNGSISSNFIKVHSWNEADEFIKLIFDVLIEELNLKNER